MRTFDVQAIEIETARAKAFEFLREPRNLPKWAHAFRSADDNRAKLQTPNGAVEIQLRTMANPSVGTVDWQLLFPDGSVGSAQSRVTETPRNTCIYSFVLHAPPVPLEQLEGALDAQRVTLGKELAELKRILESQ